MNVFTKSDRDDLTRRMTLLTTKSADEAAKKAQEARSHECHIGIKEGGNVTKPSEWASVPDSEWGDPVNYRYPMPDKAHADNAAARWGDESNRSQYSSEEQKIIGDRIERRQRSFGESVDKDDEKKSAEEVVTEQAVVTELEGAPVAEQAVVTELEDAPVAPDETKAAKAKKPAKKPAADADGDADGDDDGDEDDDDKENNPDDSEPVDSDEDNAGKDSRFVGPPLEEEKPAKKPAKKEGDDVVANPQADALLASYNTLGAALGLAPVKLNQKGLADPEIVQLRSLAVVVDTAIDEALRILQMPDNDDQIEGKDADGALVTKSGASLSSATKARLGVVHDTLAAMAGGAHCSAYLPQEQDSADEDDLLQKRGAAISRVNMGMIKKAHDTLATMCAGMHCSDFVARHSDAPAAMAAEEEAEKSGDEAVEVVAKFDKLSASFEAMAKAFGDLKAVRDEAEMVKNEIVLARKSLGDLQADAAQIEDNLRVYGNQPTQRPTRVAGRVAPDAPAVDFAGQVTAPLSGEKSVEPSTPDEARAGAPVQYIAGLGKVRVWAKGYASSVRPSLSTDEMSLMSAVDILSYYNGGEVRVPVIG